MGSFDESGEVYQYEKMDPKAKKDWVHALRHENYIQGKGHLKIAPRGRQRKCRYCCLGILCELVDVEWKPKIVELFDGTEIHPTSNGHTDMPPEEVLEEVNLEWDAAEDLATMNDDGVSFLRIATWIEENL